MFSIPGYYGASFTSRVIRSSSHNYISLLVPLQWVQNHLGSSACGIYTRNLRLLLPTNGYWVWECTITLSSYLIRYVNGMMKYSVTSLVQRISIFPSFGIQNKDDYNQNPFLVNLEGKLLANYYRILHQEEFY